MKLSTLAKVVVLFGLCCMLAPAAKAEGTPNTPGTYFHAGPVEFWYPLAHVDATPYWKSLTTGDEMFGAQTDMFSAPRQDTDFHGIRIPANMMKISFGGITSLKANGMPYASLSLKLWNITNLKGQEISYIAAGYGHDFKINQDHVLLGATFPIW